MSTYTCNMCLLYFTLQCNLTNGDGRQWLFATRGVIVFIEIFVVSKRGRKLVLRHIYRIFHSFSIHYIKSINIMQ